MYRVSKSSTMACGVSSPPPWDFQLQPPPEGTWHICGAPLPSSTHLGPDSRSFHVCLDSQNPLGSCELARRRDLRQGQLEGRAISSRYFTHVGYFFFPFGMWCTCVCVRMHAEDQNWCGVSSLFAIHCLYQGKVSRWTWCLPTPDHRTGPFTPKVSWLCHLLECCD